MTATIALPRQPHSDWLARLRTVGLGGRGVMGLGLGRSSVGAAAEPWWLAGGVAAANAVAVYQPKGAASLAASYSNLANPGTYDAAPGVAPTLGADGWTFNGSSQYLTTGVTPATTAWSVLVRFSDGSGNGQLFGNRQTGTVNGYHIHPTYNNTTIYFRNAGNYNQAGIVASGVVGIAGKTAYINGSSVGSISAVYSLVACPIYIGASNDVNVAVNQYLNGKVFSFAIYDTTLTAPQVALISAAMAAL